MTPDETEEEIQKRLSSLSMLAGIEIVVDPNACGKGETKWRHGPGIRLALVFHDDASREVWLDAMREQGIKG